MIRRLSCILVLWAGGGVAFALPAYRAPDTSHPSDAEPDITWAGSWEATWQSNTARWAEGLAKAEADEPTRQRRLRLREVVLLRAMVERFQPAGPQRRAAYEMLIERFAALSDPFRANCYRRKLIEEFPGRIEDAVDLLARIAREPGDEQPGAWLEYATAQLAALESAGALPTSHPVVVDALKRRLAARIEDGRLHAAWRDWQRLRDHLGEDDPYVVAHLGLLYYRAGRPREAAETWQRVESPRASGIRDLQRLIDRAAGAAGGGDAVLAGGTSLEMRLLSLGQQPDAETVRSLLADAAEANAVMGVGPNRYRSVWHVVDEAVAAAGPLKRQLALTGGPGARALLAAGGGSAEQAVRALRQFPWAGETHDALLSAGETLLREGAPGLALRMFRDVYARSDDAARRRWAQVGVCLALAQLPGEARRRAALDELQDDDAYPWMGRQVKGAELRALLASRTRPAEPVPCAPVAPGMEFQPPAEAGWTSAQLRHLPAVLPAAPVTLNSVNGTILAAAATFVARYSPSRPEPLWRRTAAAASGGGTEDPWLVPGWVRPVVGDGRVYCRWGLDPRGAYATAIAAWDRDTGELRWTTEDEPRLRNVEFISDPAFADGRMYALAVQGDRLFATPVYAVCVRASSGELLWHRELAGQVLGLFGGRNERQRRVDLTHYGASVTVRDGEVYCQTAAGFVARCDARDGVVEWMRTYPRVPEWVGATALAARAGPPPILTDAAVIVLPRDAAGAFALQRRTGEPVWDAPFAPSEYAAEAAGGQVTVAGGSRVAMLDLASGKTAWAQELPTAVIAPPRADEDSVTVGTRAGLVRLSRSSGIVLGQAGWPQKRPTAFAILDGALVTLGDSPEAPGPVHPVGQQADAAGPFDLPVAKAWELDRPDARLLTAPEGTGFEGRLYIVSAGMIECLDPAGAGKVLWRRSAPATLLALQWHGRMLLGVTSVSAAAWDGETGRCLWNTDLPARCDRAEVLGGHLVALTHGDDKWPYEAGHVAVVSAESGRLLWHRRIGGRFGWLDRALLRGAGWDGDRLHLLLYSKLRNRNRFALATCRLSDGVIIDARPVLGTQDTQQLDAFIAGGELVVIDEQRRPHLLPLSGKGQPFATKHALPTGKDRYRTQYAHQSVAAQASGPYIVIRMEGPPWKREAFWCVYSRDDPDVFTSSGTPGWIVGDTWYTRQERPGARRNLIVSELAALDLRTGGKLFVEPIPHPRSRRAEVLDIASRGGRLLVLTHLDRFTGGDVLRLEIRDAATGKMVRSQMLGARYAFDERPKRNEKPPPELDAPRIVWAGGRLLVAGDDGVHAYGRASAGSASATGQVRFVHRTEDAITVDGSPDDWDPRDAVPMTALDGGEGRLYLAHDGRRLYVAVSVRDDNGGRALRGRGLLAEGDFLDLALTTNRGQRRLRLGVATDGSVHLEQRRRDRGATDIKDLQGAVRYDPATARTTYEAAFALDGLSHGPATRDLLGLAATVYDTRDDRGAVPVYRLGRDAEADGAGGVANRLFRLRPMTRRAEQAGASFAEAHPWLPLSRDYLHERLRDAADGIEATVAEATRLLKRHAGDASRALAVVTLVDQVLRADLDDPVPRVLEAARRAGVPAATLEEYLALTRAYLSQWVYLTGETRVIHLWLQDEQGSWRHHAYWGSSGDARHSSDAVPDGLPGQWPAGEEVRTRNQWLELRVPLIALDMQNRPICGIRFACWGGQEAVFDRTAIVRDGSETVIIDDDFPGEVSGGYRWVEQPVKSGRRAHRTTPSVQFGDYWGEYTISLARPVTAHVPGEPARGVSDVATLREDLRKVVAQAAGSETGWEFFTRLLDLEHAGEDPKRFGAVIDWYLAANPRRPYLTELARWVMDRYPRPEEPTTQPAAPRPDTAALARALREAIARERGDWAGFTALVALEGAAADPARIADLARWYLKLDPASAHVGEMLGMLAAACEAAGRPGAAAAAGEELLGLSRVPADRATKLRADILYARRTFVRDWQVLGPLPRSRGKDEIRIERDGVDLAKAYCLGEQTYRWRRHTSETNSVDLDAIYGDQSGTGAYAVCWLHAPQPREARIAFTADDGGTVWLNGKRVIEQSGFGGFNPGRGAATVTLPAGWSELLVYDWEGVGEWRFMCQVIAPDGRGMPEGLKLSTAPPPAAGN